MKEYSREQLAILKLASVEGIGYQHKKALAALSESLADLMERPERYRSELRTVGTDVLDKLLDINESFDENAFLRYLEKYDIVALFEGEDEYPRELEILDDAPTVLFCRGNLSLLKGERFAVVGTRFPTRYGRDVTDLFARDVSKAGYTIVSGLARGVDAIAHAAALEGDASTIAVLGCGVDRVYPAENRDLYGRIAEKGLLLSEYFPGAEPLSYHFPHRNRIISALSMGVLVTEAGKKSGTLITVNEALSQGKDVFIVPGNIFSAQSMGANDMLHNPQCMVAIDPEDILSYYGKKGQRVEPDAHQLTTEEVIIYSALTDDDKHFEELLSITGLSMGELMATLTKLEVLGVIKKHPGNYYGIY